MHTRKSFPKPTETLDKESMKYAANKFNARATVVAMVAYFCIQLAYAYIDGGAARIIFQMLIARGLAALFHSENLLGPNQNVLRLALVEKNSPPAKSLGSGPPDLIHRVNNSGSPLLVVHWARIHGLHLDSKATKGNS